MNECGVAEGNKEYIEVAQGSRKEWDICVWGSRSQRGLENIRSERTHRPPNHGSKQWGPPHIQRRGFRSVDGVLSAHSSLKLAMTQS